MDFKVACIAPPLHFPVNEYGHGYQPPLGLLSVAGPLVDNGFKLELIDADAAHLSNQYIVDYLKRTRVDCVLVGHSGSMVANSAALRLIALINDTLPSVFTVYGGVYSTYAYHEIMRQESGLDFIVLGEGEQTTLELLQALANKQTEFSMLKGLAWRSSEGKVVCNAKRAPIENLDQYRVAWELVDWSLYPGRHLDGRGAIVQFSRGCGNTCTYCGQWMFWKRWRHKNIQLFVDELQFLNTVHNVQTVWIADENWGQEREIFQTLLVAIRERKLNLSIFCAISAEDVVRDADILELYRDAGIVCLMMGVESFDDEVLSRVKKNNPSSLTQQAVSLLRKHDILSVLNVIFGLRDETWQTLFSTFFKLRSISPDFLNALHFTPISWTPEGKTITADRIIQADQRKWDFRTPVVQPHYFSAKGLGIAVKCFEGIFYFRPFWIWKKYIKSTSLQRQIMRDALPRLIKVYFIEWLELLKTKFETEGKLAKEKHHLALLMPRKSSEKNIKKS